MAPGSNPGAEVAPTMYSQNRIESVMLPRAHMFCDKEKGGDIWMRKQGALVAGCTKCITDYFLVPNHHIESMMVGSCYKIDQYKAWVDAINSASLGKAKPLACSVFTNNVGMQTSYFGGVANDQWNNAPKSSQFNPRGFVCTTASEVEDHTVDGDFNEGYRQLQLFKTIVARFVMCHTGTVDGTGMSCTKRTLIGKCHNFNMRNAAFDQNAAHLAVKTGDVNSTVAAESQPEWDARALAAARQSLVEGLQNGEAVPTIGLHVCQGNFLERMLAVHQ